MASNASRARSTVAALSAVRRAPSCDDVDRVARVGLDGADQRGDRAGGRARLLGELADLLGDDGEAAALLAGARRLDGGVERQQVGLRGDRGDRLDDAADLIGLGAELADGDGGRRRGLARRRPSRRSPRARPRRRRWPGRAPRRRRPAVSWAPSADCVVAPVTSATVSRAELDGAHLALGAGGDLVDGAGDLAHGAAGLLGAVGQLARGRRHGRRGQRHLADHGGQRGARGVVGLHRGRGVVADLAHGLGHVADLVARAPVDRRGDGRELEGQVAGGEVAEPVAQAGDVVAAQRGQARDDRLDAEADAADGGHAGRDGDEEDEGEQREHEPARAVEGAGRLAGERIALGDLGVVEVLEVGAERVGGGVQALRGPLVGQLGRVGARDAEELARDAAVGGEVVPSGSARSCAPGRW